MDRPEALVCSDANVVSPSNHTDTVPEPEAMASIAQPAGSSGSTTELSSSCQQQSIALLVSNIPLTSRGHRLAATLRDYLAQHAACTQLPVVKIAYNIHGHVRNGTCLLLCNSRDTASAYASVLVDDIPNGSGGTRTSTVPPCLYEGAALRFDRCAGKLRDHLFPHLPYAQRRAIVLDPEATYSVTDAVQSFRMATVLRLFANATKKDKHCVQGEAVATPSTATALDAMACVGGNTIGLLLCFDRVVAVEVDACRLDGLMTNVRLHAEAAAGGAAAGGAAAACGNAATPQHDRPEDVMSPAAHRHSLGALTTLCDDVLSLVWDDASAHHNTVGVEQYPTTTTRRMLPIIDGAIDVAFFDPPWGGTDYASTIAAFNNDLPLMRGPKEGGSTSTDPPTTVTGWILETCGCLGTLPLAPVVVWKLPSAMDLTDIAARLTAAPPTRLRSGHRRTAVGGCSTTPTAPPNCGDVPLECHNGGTDETLPVADEDKNDRCFPFRLHFGAHTTLLVVAVASNAQRPCASVSCGENTQASPPPVAQDDKGPPPLWFSNRALDEIVAALVQWNQSIGCRECRPEFYDYEKRRWIVCKKWIPSNMRGVA